MKKIRALTRILPVQLGFHWEIRLTKKCRIPRGGGSKTKRNARQVFEGGRLRSIASDTAQRRLVYRAKRTLSTAKGKVATATFRLIAPLCISFLFNAVETNAAAGTALFLLREPTARVTAMGGAAAALSDDAGAVYINPAGLAFMPPHRLSGSAWSDRNGTDHYVFMSAICAAGRLGAFDISYLSRNSGGPDLFDRDANGSPLNIAEEYALGLGWGISPLKGVAAGGQVKYLVSELYEAFRDATSTFDLGAQYRSPGRRFSLGTGIRNTRGRLRYSNAEDRLAQVIYAGGGLRVPAGEGELLFAADLQKPGRRRATDTSLGAEYAIKHLALRLGGKRVNRENSLTLGAGYSLNRFRVDYGFVPAGRVDQPVHKVTITVFFGPRPL